MAEGIKKKSPANTNTINVNEREEVRWWCEKLGCNEMRLKNAIRAVGPSAEAVKKYMTKRLTL